MIEKDRRRNSFSDLFLRKPGGIGSGFRGVAEVGSLVVASEIIAADPLLAIETICAVIFEICWLLRKIEEIYAVILGLGWEKAPGCPHLTQIGTINSSISAGPLFSGK
ncbi:MAG: hypothetical protein KID09_04675 [Paenibacillus macerans]|uniref:hypothetical protein n=1 Tax=Paenibacillus macerans TaxID=44252 RepID=UPI00242CA73D|nr:hypothetical protein [Paenibacillus macerans]MBS5909944.1 hypothetical protein [Paenibacillus macerans]MDU5945668.1 hypothetical protein [Paenibacillus macerans]